MNYRPIIRHRLPVNFQRDNNSDTLISKSTKRTKPIKDNNKCLFLLNSTISLLTVKTPINNTKRLLPKYKRKSLTELITTRQETVNRLSQLFTKTVEWGRNQLLKINLILIMFQLQWEVE